MLREMDLVERDWAALFWALGSATALFRGLGVRHPCFGLSDSWWHYQWPVAAVLTVLNLLAYPFRLPWHPEKVAGFGFL
jgi:hypothetical protein